MKQVKYICSYCGKRIPDEAKPKEFDGEFYLPCKGKGNPEPHWILLESAIRRAKIHNDKLG